MTTYGLSYLFFGKNKIVPDIYLDMFRITIHMWYNPFIISHDLYSLSSKKTG